MAPAARRKSRTLSSKLLYVEWFFWTTAVVCALPLALTASARWLYAEVPAAAVSTLPEPLPTQPHDLPQVEIIEKNAPGAAAEPSTGLFTYAKDVLSTWSEHRRHALQTLLDESLPARIATLRLPTVPASIPVFPGDGEVQMTLGAGHLLDTSPLDGEGNAALSSHRDGAFRVLRNLQIGDHVELLLDQTQQYRTYQIREIFIVEPTDVSVLAPTSKPYLTLITCYPFYFVGNAPQRYIVRAELIADESPTRLQAQNSPIPKYPEIEKEKSDV